MNKKYKIIIAKFFIKYKTEIIYKHVHYIPYRTVELIVKKQINQRHNQKAFVTKKMLYIIIIIPPSPLPVLVELVISLGISVSPSHISV